MRVLITGALGFIGSHIADAFIERGDEVIGIDNLTGNVVNHIDGMRLFPFDARVTHMVQSRADLVVHAASPVGAVALLTRPSIVAEIVETTQSVLQYCTDHQATLINISSSEIYGFSGVYRESDDCVIPHQLTPRIQYAAGKLAAEHLVRTAPVMALTVRPFNIAGPRQTSAKGFVIPTFVEQAIAGRPLTVFDGGNQERSFTAVWDVVDFVLAVSHGFFEDVVNLGNPANRTTVLELAQRVIGLLDGGSIEHTTGKAVHGPAYEEAKGVIKVPDCTLARREGWQPMTGLDDMIVKTAMEIRTREAVNSGA